MVKHAAALLIAVTALSGCGESGTVRVRLQPYQRVVAVVDLVEEAAAMLDLDVEFTTSRHGAVDVTMVVPTGVPPFGWSDSGIGCRRDASSVMNPVILAHELGHALGLEHHHDPDNLLHYMLTPVSAYDVTDDQRADVRSSAAVLMGCVGR
jgi:hypothetical protein